MIYLKGLGGDVRVFKDCDLKEVKNLTDSGQWVRINDRKEQAEYVSSKPKKKKASKSGK